jgi:Bacteriocin-protection, YdeI or OmpD-Associated/Domain of unknown function (DUF1905)
MILVRPAKVNESKSTISFRGKLLPAKENEKAGPSWAVTLPKSVSAKLPWRGRVMVEGTISSVPFRAGLEAEGIGRHRLRVNKTMRDEAGAQDGATVMVEITRVGDEPEVRLPGDLRRALAAAPLALAGWEDITPLARRDWIFSISSAKQAETRRRRIAKACDMLASGKRRLCCFPGVAWMMMKNAKSCGMWLPLAAKKRASSGPVTA